MSLFDPSKSRPASIYPTLALLNNFLVNSHQFLNSFSEIVEKKISGVSSKITQLEILLSIVEAKLNSIPDLESSPNVLDEVVTVPTATAHPVQSIPSPPPRGPPPPGPPPILPTDITTSIEHPSVSVAKQEEYLPADNPSEFPPGKAPASSHPSYAPFMKMLKVGVPPPVVANKLIAAGLDDSVVYSML
jgi:WASH complex subunit CCDC53